MNAVSVYQENAVNTQSQGRLIVMLYDGAIKFLRQAQDSISANDIPGRNRFISKARDIVFELNASLNMEQGGRIAQNLRSLYNFIWRYLGDANLKNDPRMIDKVIGMLDDLAGAWRKISV
jgi:flagellar protein FliS